MPWHRGHNVAGLKREWAVFMNAMTVQHYLLKIRASLKFYIPGERKGYFETYISL